ncbi:MFS transporter [Actinomadura sp. 21ATH]|uniref:MFS transporter n=1 Tax=Actinomadura sp. 21ATH TaxID=1735444 RepID=UPI0035C264A4
MLALPSILLSLDVTLLHLAVPHLGAALAPSSTQMLWIIDVYAFMIAGFLVTAGTLGDRIGRRKLLLGGGLAFGAASLLAAYAGSAEMLIAARALLGIAGATLMPSTLALISTMFQNPRQRGTAIGIWAASFSVGIALGPVVGGAMLEMFWWGSVFLLAVPVMALLLITGPLLLPEYKDENAGRIDPISVVLSLATILPAVYGVKEIAKHGVQSVPLIALVVGLAFGVVFVRRQLRLDDPMLDLSLFRSRAFSVALGVMLFAAVAMGGIYLFVTQYLQMVAGLSPLRAGLWLLPAAGLLIASSMLAPIAARRIRPGTVTAIGLILSAIGYLTLTQAGAGDNGLAYVVIGFGFIYTGIGPVMGLSVSLIVGSAPRRRPVPPPPSSRPAATWASRSASRPWAASAPPSTATASPVNYPPAPRPRWPTPAATLSPGLWRPPVACPDRRPTRSSHPPAMPSRPASTSSPWSERFWSPH